MKLDITFNRLHLAIELMKPEKRGKFNLAYIETDIEKLNKELDSGRNVELKDVDVTPGGILSHKGRQILLYIQDHGFGVKTALLEGSQGRKYHVADCKILKEMRAKGKFEHYVITNKLSARFLITGRDRHTKMDVEGYADLNVCKVCLTYLNYKGYQEQGKSVNG